MTCQQAKTRKTIMPYEISVNTPATATATPEQTRESRRLARSLMFGGTIILLLCFCLILRVLAFEGAWVTSKSMEPTLFKGDYALIDHRTALRGQWQRGDVVLFPAPESWDGPGVPLVKRIVGLPGETVAILSGRVLINGKPLAESHLAERPEPEDMEPIKLGNDEYWVLGDNRNNSDDSRVNGPIQEKDIAGRFLFRLWPVATIGAIS